MRKSWSEKKREALELAIDKSIEEIHGEYVPHLSLLLNVMLLAAEEGDKDYLSLSSDAFKYHCALGEFNPSKTLDYFNSL